MCNGKNKFIYQRSSSSTEESINKAKLAVQERTAINPVNAIMLLLNLESKWYQDCKAKARNWNEVLTPHGKKLCEDTFNPINHQEYEIHNQAQGNQWSCQVKRLTSINQYQCYFKSVQKDRFAFGGCSCGVPENHSPPCKHMVAVVKSCCIEGLNQVNVMPPWWMTTHWRRQYPT